MDNQTDGALVRWVREQDWRLRARCRGRSDLDWYSTDPAEMDACKAVCWTCAAQKLCAAEAIALRDPWGIWGGLAPEERKEVTAEAGLPAPTVLPPHGTNARYAKHGCRCSMCRAAHTAYERSRLRRHAVSS